MNTVIHLDRLIEVPTTTVPASLIGGQTIWQLPYATDAVRVVCMDDDANGFVFGEEIPSTQPSPTQVAVTGDFRSHHLAIGVPYTFRAVLSPLYPSRMGRTGAVNEDRGRTQLLYVRPYLEYTGHLQVTVDPSGRTPVPYEFGPHDEPVDGSLRVPILAKNDLVTITLDTDNHLGCRVRSLEAEMEWHPRSRLRG